jgi:gluconokinase
MKVENLRSPHLKTNQLFYLARMFDKIRLHAQDRLPAVYVANLGLGFDAKACSFLRIRYEELVKRVLQGGADEELVQWCFMRGRTPTEGDIEMWNEWMRKFGWNDKGTARLRERMIESGFEDRIDVQTVFDYIDLDEERDPKNRSEG